MTDAAVAYKESATFHGGDKSAILIQPLHFMPVPLGTVSAFVKTHHYSRTHPGGVDYSFALYFNGVLAGAALFGHMAGNPKAACVCEGDDNPKNYRELMRLVLLDEVPKNSESQFVAWCIRWLRKNAALTALISFADPREGHSGVIYRASNWTYCGVQKQDRDRLIVDGVEVHPKSAYNRWGTSSVPGLRQLGLTVQTLPREPKHRYIYLLKPGRLKTRVFNGITVTA